MKERRCTFVTKNFKICKNSKYQKFDFCKIHYQCNNKNINRNEIFLIKKSPCGKENVNIDLQQKIPSISNLPFIEESPTPCDEDPIEWEERDQSSILKEKDIINISNTSLQNFDKNEPLSLEMFNFILILIIITILLFF